jgi:hypothetical protein
MSGTDAGFALGNMGKIDYLDGPGHGYLFLLWPEKQQIGVKNAYKAGSER